MSGGASHLVHIGAVRGEGGEEAGQGGAAVLLQDALQPPPGRGIKIHTFLAFLFVILPNKHRPSFMGTFVIAIHRVARNIYGPALPCTFVINKTPGGQF